MNLSLNLYHNWQLLQRLPENKDQPTKNIYYEN